MKNKKERVYKRKFYFLNFVINELSKQIPENYIEVFANICDKKIQINTYGDRKTFITSFYKVGNHYEGIISNAIFVNPDSSSIDGLTYVVSNSDVDPNKGLSLKQWRFYFFPKYHRMAIVSGCSLSQIYKFFNEAFKEIYGEFDYINVNIEKERSIIDRIIESKTLESLELELSYSNNDCFEDWSNILDVDMKEAGTKCAKFSFKSLAGRYLDITKTSFMKALLYISKSNGFAKAKLRNEQGRHEVVNTNDFPKQVQVEYSGDSPANELNDIVSRISNNTDA